MSPQRRTALLSIVAALILITLKVAAGLHAGSLGLLSEAAHSGTDLVAALLTFFAVGVAVRPADPGHLYGHGKAEHLAALAEAAILVAISLAIAGTAVARLFAGAGGVHVTWFALTVIAVVIVVDASRALVSARAARRYASAAFASSALHFASDLAGSAAVLVGLLAARSGHPRGDAVAALFVSTLVLGAAGRLMKTNVDVLMDRVPATAHEAARVAIEELGPRVQLRRLRMRRAAGRHFADVVVAVPPVAGVEGGHAVADAVEEAVERVVPGADVVVHVEPQEADALRERAYAAAVRDSRVREVHNIVVLEVGDRTEVSLHLKLPGEYTLEEAHAVASAVEDEILEALPEVDAVQTHLEPLAETAAGVPFPHGDRSAEAEEIRRIVVSATGEEPRELRLLNTEVGLVAFLTLELDAERPLAEAHARASDVEERIRRAHPEIADVVVHTEP
ncbi:MAG TPA: cation diffusion facilitator family transporter [Gaiellaceae bacterium]|jgi:cation diffusion facilitator family transporter|nr:cation diffusion facilitator family transporter [Gaiellaceae bacterium]